LGPTGCRPTIFRQVIVLFLQLMFMKVSDGYRTEMDIDSIGNLHLSTIHWGNVWLGDQSGCAVLF
jgi:hypothetical protein